MKNKKMNNTGDAYIKKMENIENLKEKTKNLIEVLKNEPQELAKKDLKEHYKYFCIIMKVVDSKYRLNHYSEEELDKINEVFATVLIKFAKKELITDEIIKFIEIVTENELRLNT